MNIAIQGHPTRGKEVIKILESLGTTSYRIYDKCSHPEWYWYINKNKEIVCGPKSSMWGYKLYTLEEFEKEFPFKIGDIVLLKGTNNPYEIIALEWFMDKLCYKLDNGLHYGPKTLTTYEKMKEERNITLTLEKAKEWYTKGGELKEVALQAYSEEELTKAELPKTWEEFCTNFPMKNGECYINSCCDISKTSECIEGRDIEMDKNVCPSQKSAEAHLAMIQLEQLRDCWRQGWKPDWNNVQQPKFYVTYYKGRFKISTLYETRRFLSFPTVEMAEEFLKCFRDLIEKAGDLI